MVRSVRYLLLALLVLVVSSPVFAQVEISVGFGPPALPVYEQPICPEDGYIWTPGYWAWDPDYGYYWVPGTWVLAPQVGYLWTPPWWGWGGSAYIFHAGYWGPHIGFYGGINYGFGYFGNGYEGGRWNGDHFYYNRSVTNINVTNIHNTYNTVVVNRNNVSRVSYNGGQGGLNVHPTAEQQTIDREHHLAPIASQQQHVQLARANPELRARTNQGKPPIAATDRPGSFTGHNVVAAKEAGAPYHPPAAANRPGTPAAEGNHPAPTAAHTEPTRPGAPAESAPHANPTHASELPPHQAGPAPNTGNPKLDQKYEQQQQKLAAKQNAEHQKLMQQQQKQDQRAQQQHYAQPRQQQMEQRHQQQTMQMQQRHTQQTQAMQQRQSRPAGRPH